MITQRKMNHLNGGIIYVTKIGMNLVIAICQPLAKLKIHADLHVKIVLVKFMFIRLKLLITY